MAALAGLIVLGVWAVACELPPSRVDDPLLAKTYPLNFGREIRLLPMPGHPDEAIVEAFIRRRDDAGPFFQSDDELARFDRGQIDMTRFRVEPGVEPQIVFVVTGIDHCPPFYGCTGNVLTKTNDGWALLTGFGVMGTGLGFTVAARPFWVRPKLDPGVGRQEVDHGSRVLVRPVNAGRPTFVGRTTAVYWGGTQWELGCWQLCEHQ